MAPAPWTVCRFYLQGKCRNGDKCKFRHHVPGLVVVAKQAPPPVEYRGRTMALLVHGNIKATFAAGVVPVTVEHLMYSKHALQIESIDTTLSLKWSVPGRTLSLGYISRASALWAFRHLDSIYPELNVKIYIVDEFGGSTALVPNIPKSITDYDILKKLPPAYKPERVTSKDPGEPNICEIVRRLTGQHCTITNKGTFGKGLGRQAEIKFRGSPRLDSVARKVHEQPIPGFGDSKIYAVENVSIWLYLSSKIYQQYQYPLIDCVNRIPNKVRIHILERGSYGPTYMKVTGDRGAVIAAKMALDRVLIPRLAGPLSPPTKPSNQTHRIVLSKLEDYIRATNGGIMRAKALLGDNVIYLEPESAPPAIIVKGDTATLRKVQRELDPNGKLIQRTKPRCAICWDEAEDFVKVEGCGDVACKECFVQYCTVSRDNKFPLRCFQENCSLVLQLDQIRSALGEDVFLRLASEAVEHYIQQRPDEYVKCSGPDCSAYSPTNKSEVHNCASCFTPSCQDCKVEYHYGETCREYKERVLGHMEKLQKWIEKEGAKRCPRCDGIVQKEFGCDNVKCPLCKIDFCWACLKSYESHDAVYKHQIKEHGSYFADPQEYAAQMRQLLGDDVPARFFDAHMRQIRQPPGPVQPPQDLRPHRNRPAPQERRVPGDQNLFIPEWL